MKRLLVSFGSVLVFLVSFPTWGMEFECTSSTYLDCGGGHCNTVVATVNLTVDFGERMVLRETQKNGRDSMALETVWSRDNDNSYYVLYEDENSHGFVVLNRLSGDIFGYTDTLYTNLGGWVSSGRCRRQ